MKNSTRAANPSFVGKVNFSYLTVILLVAGGVLCLPAAQAQTYTVIHNFNGAGDGSFPYAGVTLDRGGNLYGTTYYGGNTTGPCSSDGCGVVFKLSQRNSHWILTPLYSFQGGPDGSHPQARVVIGPNGSLYGTTSYGGATGCTSNGCGTVFNLKPSTHATGSVLGNWGETILYAFQGGSDGANPGYGDLLFDHAGNIYGTTTAGGPSNQGTVFKLTASNGSWTETVLYSFTGGADGGTLNSGVILDSAGNLYGVASRGGAHGFGTVYELTPSGSQWVETTLYAFQDQLDGRAPTGGLIMDQSGNIYGTTSLDGELQGGTVWKLTRNGGGWTFGTIQLLPGNNGVPGPVDALTADAAGNLYATSVEGNGSWGQVWELISQGSGWLLQNLYQFHNNGDGALPYGSVALDANGNLFGTTSRGGMGNCLSCGVVWEITP
jgi:uncharacterized repeat protein (TIGR03803 family)